MYTLGDNHFYFAPSYFYRFLVSKKLFNWCRAISSFQLSYLDKHAWGLASTLDLIIVLILFEVCLFFFSPRTPSILLNLALLVERAFYFSFSKTQCTALARCYALFKEWQQIISAHSGSFQPEIWVYQSDIVDLVSPIPVVSKISFQSSSSYDFVRLSEMRQRKSLSPGAQISLNFAAKNRHTTKIIFECSLCSKKRPYTIFFTFYDLI